MNKGRRIKVLQLHPDYNIKAHDFADLGEQIFRALPSERFETVNAFLRGGPASGQPVSRAERSVYFGFSDSQLMESGYFFRKNILTGTPFKGKLSRSLFSR